MKKLLPFLLIPLIIATIARGQDGEIAAGILGGVAAGAVAGALGAPVYPYAPVYGPGYGPGYYAPYGAPAYVQDPVAVEEAADMRQRRLERARQERQQRAEGRTQEANAAAYTPPNKRTPAQIRAERDQLNNELKRAEAAGNK
jgi:hypothetical protein